MYKVIRNLYGKSVVSINNQSSFGEITLFTGTKSECNQYIK